MINKSTKIIATLGPTADDLKTIRQLLLSGADIFRLNLSHGSHAYHRDLYKKIRQIEKEEHRTIGIIMDIQGPKIRIGTFKKGPIQLVKGRVFTLTLEPCDGDDKCVQFFSKDLINAVSIGDMLVLDDSKLFIKVISKTSSTIVTRVVIGGILSDKKGINVPNKSLAINSITPKDILDIKLGLELGVDFIALSFVQSAHDIMIAKDLVQDKIKIIAKLEKPLSVGKHLHEIIELSDAIMIARGDLGVETPMVKLPILQKKVINLCKKANKPVIVATQMLDSMIYNPLPTRAETSDIANSVLDGADCLMLSGETANGLYPVKSVKIMSDTIRNAEKYEYDKKDFGITKTSAVANVIISCSARIAANIDAKAIIAYSLSGNTSILIAKSRPNVPVLGITTKLKTAKYMTLMWGIYPIFSKHIYDSDDVIRQGISSAKIVLNVKNGTNLIVVGGLPVGKKVTTNSIRVVSI